MINSGPLTDISLDDGYLTFSYDKVDVGGFINPIIDKKPSACIIKDKDISKHVYHVLITSTPANINYDNILMQADKTLI